VNQAHRLSELQARRAAAAGRVDELEAELDRYDRVQLRQELVTAVRLLDALDALIAAGGSAP
jgi:hypothetical protein